MAGRSERFTFHSINQAMLDVYPLTATLRVNISTNKAFSKYTVSFDYGDILSSTVQNVAIFV